MKKKTALITGIAGMDGSHLADFLLEKDYNVVGVIRRNATRNLGNASHLEKEPNVELVEGDITDMSSMMRLVQLVRPHELYSLAAQSHVATSFEQPVATFNINVLGVINILEIVKCLGLSTRIMQASTSELWGDSPPPQNEETMMRPRSPYAIAKLAAHWMVKLYREAYGGIYCCCAITHNHEGPRRGPLFVTRKISMGVAAALKNPEHKIMLGNLDAMRDWGYAPEYIEAFWLMLQQEKPDDYVIATGEMHSVREFCEEAFSFAGLDWRNHVEVDRFLKRPVEVEALCGSPAKAEEKLGWKARTKFKDLVRIMVESDCRLLGVEDKLPEYKLEFPSLME